MLSKVKLFTQDKKTVFYPHTNIHARVVEIMTLEHSHKMDINLVQ